MMTNTRDELDAMEQFDAVFQQTRAALLGLAAKFPNVQISLEIQQSIANYMSDLRSDAVEWHKERLEEKLRQEGPYRPEGYPEERVYPALDQANLRTLNAFHSAVLAKVK